VLLSYSHHYCINELIVSGINDKSCFGSDVNPDRLSLQLISTATSKKNVKMILLKTCFLMQILAYTPRPPPPSQQNPSYGSGLQ
jgi:hypothetical protein